MAPFLVLLGLLLLGVTIVAWHTREIWWHVVAPFLPAPPLTRAAKAAATAPAPALAPVFPIEPDAFAAAPTSRSFVAAAPAASPPVSAHIGANDPFAHAPALSDLAGFQTGETRH